MDRSYEAQVGANIRLLRERAGLTQEELSVRLQLQGCDITRSALAKIEVGQRHIYVDELELLHRLLKARYPELLPDRKTQRRESAVSN